MSWFFTSGGQSTGISLSAKLKFQLLALGCSVFPGKQSETYRKRQVSLSIAGLHSCKRHLLLGRKAMTNLDSLLKSRDVTWLTKVCIVKAMVFPVVTYGCESWTIKKTECRRTDAFEL